MYNYETPIWQLTVAELSELLNKQLSETNKKYGDNHIEPPKKYVYGIPGIAELFHCSIATANRIKQSGVIDQAIKQIGKKIMVDAESALQLINNQQGMRLR